jgi:hypothetical protein
MRLNALHTRPGPCLQQVACTRSPCLLAPTHLVATAPHAAALLTCALLRSSPGATGPPTAKCQPGQLARAAYYGLASPLMATYTCMQHGGSVYQCGGLQWVLAVPGGRCDGLGLALRGRRSWNRMQAARVPAGRCMGLSAPQGLQGVRHRQHGMLVACTDVTQA